MEIELDSSVCAVSRYVSARNAGVGSSVDNADPALVIAAHTDPRGGLFCSLCSDVSYLRPEAYSLLLQCQLVFTLPSHEKHTTDCCWLLEKDSKRDHMLPTHLLL